MFDEAIESGLSKDEEVRKYLCEKFGFKKVEATVGINAGSTLYGKIKDGEVESENKYMDIEFKKE